MSEGSVFQRKDGKFCAKYKGADGAWKYLYRRTKTEAKKALREGATHTEQTAQSSRSEMVASSCASLASEGDHGVPPFERYFPNPLSEKAPRVKRGRSLYAHLRRCALGGSRPFAHRALGKKKASNDSCV